MAGSPTNLRTLLIFAAAAPYAVSFRAALPVLLRRGAFERRPLRPSYLAAAPAEITDLKGRILAAAAPTRRGTLSPDAETSTRVDALVRTLEAACPPEPARDVRVGGRWFVDYTDAPPPSNGVLGPFAGEAFQEVDLARGTYSNLLEVGPGGWLAARLDATYAEWDGVLLQDTRKTADGGGKEEAVGAAENIGADQGQTSPLDGLLETVRGFFPGVSSEGRKPVEDYGASCWKVDFRSLSIKLLGIEIFQKKFEDTARIWKMTYLDDETRVVRAGATGAGDDDFVFYMTKVDDT